MKGLGRLHQNNLGSQSILEFILALTAIAAFAVGITRIWVWFDANYAGLQVAYQKGRLYAGQPKKSYDQPLNIGGSQSCPNCKYEPLDLTEEWVFAGLPTHTISGDKIDSGTGRSGGGKQDCRGRIRSTVELWRDQAKNLEDQAKWLDKQAKSMQEQAEKCDNWWELCWWGDWGKSANELKRAAKKIRRQASLLRENASALRRGVNCLNKCCESFSTVDEQERCTARCGCRLECEANRMECREKCREEFEKGRWSFRKWRKYLRCIKRCVNEFKSCMNNCRKI